MPSFLGQLDFRVFLSIHVNYRLLKIFKTLYLQPNLKFDADVAELVYALVLGTSAARLMGSSPFVRTS
jgi:hypothetical protein